MNQNEAIYDARKLGTPKMLILGLQHLFAMFGATVLVPILVSGYGLPLSIQTTLLFAGLGTLLFHVCTKLKVPAFLGSSFAYLGGFETVAKLDSGKYAAMSGDEKLAYALGGIVVAGLLYLVLALLFKVLGAKTVMRYFPPIVTGPMIVMIGLNLAGSAINNAKTCWWLALVAMGIIVVANIWGKGMVKIIPILLGVVGSYLVALAANAMGATAVNAAGEVVPLIDFSGVAAADLVGLQKFVIAKFDLTSILVMAPIAIAAMMEHIGDISAISSTTGKNFIADPGLHRTLIGDGLGHRHGRYVRRPRQHHLRREHRRSGPVQGVRSPGHPPGRRLRHHPVLLSQVRRPGQLHPHRHRGRRVLHPVRNDLRCGRAQHRGKSSGPDQVPQPDHRRCDVRLRPGLQLCRRHHLQRGQRRGHPVRLGYRRSGRCDPERHPARQRLCVRHLCGGRQVRRPGQLLSRLISRRSETHP